MKFRLIFGLSLFVSTLFAQKTGWQLVRENNWKEARAAFDAQLRAKPTDESALTGRLFLQETIQDYAGYQKTANELMAAAWKPEMVVLFGHLFDGDASVIAFKKELPENVRIPFAMGVADSFFYTRRFDEYKKQLAATVQDFNWTVVGPFPNVSGSGHIAVFAPETGVFDEKKTFLVSDNREINWLKNQKREADGRCSFSRLADSRGLGTNYATTFLEFPTSREVQFRIRRSAPMKIWLDDALIADLPETASFRWDLEVISLKITAGTHRILVKCSQFPGSNSDSKLTLDFNDHTNDGDGDYYDYNAGQIDDDEFALRVTDRDGRILPLKSDFSGKYSTISKAPEVKLESHPYLEIFKKRAEKTGEAQLGNYFLLAKMFLKYKKEEEGEAFFAEKLAENPESAYLKFIIAKFFHENGKGEKAESLLSELDTVATPTFAWELKKVNEIDPQQRETEYLAGLEKLLGLSAGHWPTMSRYLEFLKEKGRREVIEPFVKRELAARGKDKKWHDRLDDYLKADSYRPETEKEITDKEREKQFKSAQKLLKKRVDYDAYGTVIEYFKQKDKDNDVVKTFDEILSFQPWATGWRFTRARFLFEKNRLDDALAACRELIAHEPYSAELYELMGDVFLEKKDKTQALAFYKKAKKWGGEYQYGISEKIEKIENRRKYSQFFEPINLDVLSSEFRVPSSDAAVARNAELEKYKEEDSVISHFSSQTWLNEDAQLEVLNRLVIHIQTAEGAKMWTEGDYRIMGNITVAKVLKANGSVSSPELGYGGMAVFKNLAPGDIITMEGTNQMPIPDEIEGEFLMFQVLPFKVPVVSASLELLVPKDTSLMFACNRLDCNPVTTDAGEGFVKHRFVWKNLPKVVESEGAAPENLDRFPWFMASSAKDWGGVVDWYLQKTYRRTTPNYEVLQKTKELIKPSMTEQQKVDAIYTFITKDVKYSFVPFLNSNYTPKKPAETVSGSIGDCKDVATLMISMLREAGIPAWHTLVSTHTFSGKEPRPTLYVFNHAIAAWESAADKKLHFLDLTTDYFPANVLPEMDNGGWGLVIRPGETQVRRLPNDLLDPEKTKIDITAKAIVGKDRTISIETETEMRGVVAGKFREILNPKTADERQKFLADYFGGGVLNNLNFEKIKFDSLENLAAPLRSKMSVRAFNQVDKVSNFHIIPLPLPLTMPARRELFAEKRYNDLDLNDLFELAPIHETVEVTLPDGWQLLEVPKDISRKSEFGDYSLKFEKKAGSLLISRDLIFKQRFIANGDYARFKAFYLEISDFDGTKLALKQGK